jgi:hypothetical protein
MNNTTLKGEMDQLRRELIATSEILALIIKQHGEPIVVPKEFIQEGIPDDAEILCDDTGDAFVFSLSKVV